MCIRKICKEAESGSSYIIMNNTWTASTWSEYWSASTLKGREIFSWNSIRMCPHSYNYFSLKVHLIVLISLCKVPVAEGILGGIREYWKKCRIQRRFMVANSYDYLKLQAVFFLRRPWYKIGKAVGSEPEHLCYVWICMKNLVICIVRRWYEQHGHAFPSVPTGAKLYLCSRLCCWSDLWAVSSWQWRAKQGILVRLLRMGD